MRYQHRGIVGVDECDWVLKFDADEILRVPGGNMVRYLEALGEQGFDSLSGNWMDRVEDSGSLPTITGAPTLQEQFPLSCQFSGEAGNATTRKVVGFRGYLKEKRAGHSLLKGLETCRYPVQLIIDHYKWSWPVYQKLKQRMNLYRKLEGFYWWTESQQFLKHIDDNNGKIDVQRPEFQCEYSQIQQHPRMIHSFISMENGEAEAEPCSRVRVCPNKLQ